MTWDLNLDTCLQYYIDKGTITPECASAWQRAREAYDTAIVTGDPIPWIATRREAMAHHAPTGDCSSDKIEWSFNRVATMCNSQLEHAEGYDDLFLRQCALERAKRGLE